MALIVQRFSVTILGGRFISEHCSVRHKTPFPSRLTLSCYRSWKVFILGLRKTDAVDLDPLVNYSIITAVLDDFSQDPALKDDDLDRSTLS